jgi:hypothetical protein
MLFLYSIQYSFIHCSLVFSNLCMFSYLLIMIQRLVFLPNHLDTGNFNAELQELQLQEARAKAEKANEDLAMARALRIRTLKKVRPANRGNSWLPSPGSSSQSPAEFAIVGTSLHGESSDNDSSHLHHYPLKEREYYIELFKEKFNIEYNLSKGYKVRHNSKLMIIERVAFGSKETVHTCHGDNKKVKNDYLALVLSDCQIDKFLVLIASQAGVAEEQWWLNTP